MNALGLNNATGFEPLGAGSIHMDTIRNMHTITTDGLGWEVQLWTHHLFQGQAITWRNHDDTMTTGCIENHHTWYRFAVDQGELTTIEECNDPLVYGEWAYSDLIEGNFCCLDNALQEGCDCACEAKECDCCCRACGSNYDYCNCSSCPNCECTVTENDGHDCGCDCAECQECGCTLIDGEHNCGCLCEDTQPNRTSEVTQPKDYNAANSARQLIELLAQPAKPKPPACADPGCRCQEVA